MPKSISGKTIDAIVKAGVAQWFRSAGFKRNGRSFVRKAGELIHTANLQAGTFNTPENADFAVNLGVEWPWWSEIWTGSPRIGNPAIASTFRVRLHPTLFPDYDYWWPANPDTNVKLVAAEIAQALTRFAESFWSHYSSLDRILEDFEAGRRVPTTPLRLVNAGLLCKAGKVEKAQCVLNEAARKDPSLALVKTIAGRLGIDIVAT